jgi:AraC family transcriptional regulator
MPELNLQPRLVEMPALRIAGLSGEYTRETTSEIPGQWDRFNAQLAQSTEYRDATYTYGVVYPLARMRYVCGIELTGDAAVPEPWVEVTVPAQRYAVFAETGGIEAIRVAWTAIFAEWLPKSGMELASGAMIERYPENWIDSGDFEIWLPLAG